MESYAIESNKKKSRLPARLDALQSGTGLVLGLFMWVHMLLVASIILGKGMFNWVARTMELSFLSGTGEGYPIAVFIAVFIVFSLFILHALLGVRKFPISWKQHRIMRDQMAMMKHSDTNLWYIQVVTGFIMFFAGSVHLYTMLTHPASIDPYLSADRVVSSNMWFVYMILLLCVELHGTIGLYRLAMKWGWFGGKDYRKGREIRSKLKTAKNRLTIFFLSLGGLALLVFIVIGIGHRGEAGQPYEARHSVSVSRDAASVAPAQEAVHGETEEAPAHEAVESEAPAHEAPAHESPAHEAVEAGAPAHGAPAAVEEHEQPAHEAPAHDAVESHEAPAHETATHEAPAVEHEPAHQGPAEHAPAAEATDH